MKAAVTSSSRLRVGIVGCGNVAEHHARFVKSLDQAQLLAVVDINEQAARAFAEKHGIPTVHASVAGLLDSMELDVLHVTTPPAFHYDCAKTALERGVHVFIEKPIAFSLREVNELYELAAARDLILCPDYIQLFHPKMQQLLGLIDSGKLGRVVHVDSHWCLNLDEEVRPGEGLHWGYRLPGGLLRDYSSHVLYQALYFAGRPTDIRVNRKSMGNLPQGMTDQLLIQIDGDRCSANVLLTCQARPSSYGIRVFCEQGSAAIDFDTQTLIVNRQGSLPRRIRSITKNFSESWSLSTQTVGNVWNYLRGRLVPYSGLQTLIPRLYESILKAQLPPVSRELAVAVTTTEEALFSTWTEPVVSGRYVPSSQSHIRQQPRVAVTGASGYVGFETVKALVESGYYVRALVRPTGRTERLQRLGVEIFLGDVRRASDLTAAAAGMDIIVHAAAGMKGDGDAMVDTCVRGTENIALAATEQRVKRVIYISSFSVYNYSAMKNRGIIDENSPLEDQPETRGSYTIGKTRAEQIALAHLHDDGTAWTILRPSLVVGGSSDMLGPVGSKLGDYVVSTGAPSKQLLLIHVQDLANAIVKLIDNENTKGKVFTISDPETITTRDYVTNCVRRSKFRDVRVLFVPYFVARLMAVSATAVRKLTGIGPNVNRRRLLSLYRNVGADSSLLFQQIGWRPQAGLLERLVQEAEVEQLQTEDHEAEMAVGQA